MSGTKTPTEALSTTVQSQILGSHCLARFFESKYKSSSLEVSLSQADSTTEIWDRPSSAITWTLWRLKSPTTRMFFRSTAVRWRHNERDGISNHQARDCLLNHYSDADQRRHQSSASLAFVRGIHRWPVNSPTQMASNAEMFPFGDVIINWNSSRVRNAERVFMSRRYQGFPESLSVASQLAIFLYVRLSLYAKNESLHMFLMQIFAVTHSLVE